jgi:uncharacterized membrane protein
MKVTNWMLGMKLGDLGVTILITLSLIFAHQANYLGWIDISLYGWITKAIVLLAILYTIFRIASRNKKRKARVLTIKQFLPK